MSDPRTPWYEQPEGRRAAEKCALRLDLALGELEAGRVPTAASVLRGWACGIAAEPMPRPVRAQLRFRVRLALAALEGGCLAEAGIALRLALLITGHTPRGERRVA